jgi:hypothetical protein
VVRENLSELGNWKLKVWSQLAQTAYAWPARVGLAVIASVSLTGSNPDTVTGRVQVRPPSCERLATIAEGGFTRSPRKFIWRPRKYAVPSGPTDTHGSLAESAVPPVQAVRPGIWLRRHVLPPSCDHPMRSLREAMLPPRSCCQVPMRFRGCAGLTAIAGSISSPATCIPSSAAPGQPPANGLGPDTTRRCPAAPGRGLAAASDTLPAHKSPLAAIASPAVAKNLNLIAHPPATPQKSKQSVKGPPANHAGVRRCGRDWALQLDAPAQLDTPGHRAGHRRPDGYPVRHARGCGHRPPVNPRSTDRLPTR